MLAGTVALVVGFTLLALPKGTNRHRRLGRNFCYLALVVGFSAPRGPALFAKRRRCSYATLGALATILIYGTLRWAFPRRWYLFLWKYEHVYNTSMSTK